MLLVFAAFAGSTPAFPVGASVVFVALLEWI
jgi:hypothetical protein